MRQRVVLRGLIERAGLAGGLSAFQAASAKVAAASSMSSAMRPASQCRKKKLAGPRITGTYASTGNRATSPRSIAGANQACTDRKNARFTSVTRSAVSPVRSAVPTRVRYSPRLGSSTENCRCAATSARIAPLGVLCRSTAASSAAWYDSTPSRYSVSAIASLLPK